MPYQSMLNFFIINELIAGERGRNRTYNLVIKSHLLCQLSYAPRRLRNLISVAPCPSALLQ